MLDTLAVAAAVAALFTAIGFAITRAGRYADQATVILAAVATGLGLLALIVGLARLEAQGPAAIFQADARPDYGMSWRPLAGMGARVPERALRAHALPCPGDL